MTDVVLGRRERKKEETKRRIFVAALELFREKGFAATTIDEITARADVAKGTFFNYFPRKEGVIEFLAEEQLESVEGTVHENQSATERLRTLYDALSTGYEANPDLALAVMRASLERLCCPAEGGAWQRFERLAIEVIREGQARGEFRSQLDPGIAHGALVSCFIGSVIWWLGEARESSDPRLRAMRLPDIVRGLQEVALDGLRTRQESGR
jgi:TetR/AcrR family transcriptional regulator, cholesterol catabolism regulator